MEAGVVTPITCMEAAGVVTPDSSSVAGLDEASELESPLLMLA